MKSILTTILAILISGTVWGQDEGIKNININSIKINTTIDETREKLTEEQSEEKDLNEKIKKIIDKENSDSTEIGIFYIREYAIVFPSGYPVENVISIKALRDTINKKIKDEEGENRFVTSVSFPVELEFNSSINNKCFRKKNQDLNNIVKKGEKINFGINYIDSVNVTISEGVIEHIRVFTKDGNVFTNICSPIPLLTIEKRFNDKLYNPRDNSFIFLKDAVSFEAKRRFNYFPDNQEIKIENTIDSTGKIKTGSKKLVAENGINSLVNLQVYSDLLAIFGNEANGLIQFEANSKFYLHRGTYKNSYIFTPLDAIEPFFHFSRIDSKFDTISLTAGQQVNRMELFRRYTYAVGLDVNLLRADFRPHNSFEWKLGYMYSSSNLNVNGNELSAALHTPYTELALKSKKLNNFTFDLRGRFLLQKLNKNEIIENDEWNQLISFRAGISYFPNKKKSDKIFLRFVNYLNLSDRKEDFSLLQLGFSKTISL